MEENLELSIVSKKEVYKSKKSVSGQKVRYLSKIAKDLRQQMVINGATAEEITKFQYDFLTQNGVNIPESFLNIKHQASGYEILTKFISENLQVSNENITTKMFYDKYIEYCVNNKFTTLGKQEVFSYLRNNGFMKKTGTVDGVTKRNVIIGYQLKKLGD